jgi:hypothetical protein
MHGDGNGHDLVKWMQFGGNFQIAWIMFDHVKRVKGWMILAYHVYDSFYCIIMTIAICDMQFEDMEAQCIM